MDSRLRGNDTKNFGKYASKKYQNQHPKANLALQQFPNNKLVKPIYDGAKYFINL